MKRGARGEEGTHSHPIVANVARKIFAHFLPESFKDDAEKVSLAALLEASNNVRGLSWRFVE